MAKWYAEIQEDHATVFWAKADDPHRFATELRDFADHIDPPEEQEIEQW